MSTIEFRVVDGSGDNPFCLGHEIMILVDGRPLIELIREVEAPFAAAEGHPDIAGRYRGLPAEEIRSRHFLGAPKGWYQYLPGEVMLFTCTCGEPGCWPLVARIDVNEAQVRWHDFYQPHRTEWQYEALGELVFDRGQYQTALEQAASYAANDAGN